MQNSEVWEDKKHIIIPVKYTGGMKDFIFSCYVTVFIKSPGCSKWTWGSPTKNKCETSKSAPTQWCCGGLLNPVVLLEINDTTDTKTEGTISLESQWRNQILIKTKYRAWEQPAITQMISF